MSTNTPVLSLVSGRLEADQAFPHRDGAYNQAFSKLPMHFILRINSITEFMHNKMAHDLSETYNQAMYICVMDFFRL